MNDFVKLLDSNLQYIKYEISNNAVKIWGESIRYERSFQDLPMQDKKVIIFINNRKIFCNNPKCNHKTFIETFDFLSPKGKKTKRLEDKILNI